MTKKEPPTKIKASVVNMALVEASLAAKGQPVGGTDGQKLDRLQAWYQKNTPKARIADCSTCGGESDVEEPKCPYCGDGEVADAPIIPTVPATSGKVALDDPPATPPPPSLPPPPPRGETLNIPPPPPPPSGVVPYRRGAASPNVVETTGGEGVSTPVTEEALDEAVRAISDLMVSAADKLWEVGNAIREVFDQSLWTARKNEDGSARYKSWGHFCEVELGISHGHSLKLIDVAREFTREQVRQIGPTKLHITLQVPKGEARDRLLGIAPTVNKAELSKVAKIEVEKAEVEAKTKTGRSTGRGGKGKTGKGGAGSHVAGPPRTGGRKPDKITVAMLVNRVEMLPVNEKGAKQKQRITGAPLVAEERLFNGVRQRVIVTNDDDGYVMVIVERSRE